MRCDYALALVRGRTPVGGRRLSVPPFGEHRRDSCAASRSDSQTQENQPTCCTKDLDFVDHDRSAFVQHAGYVIQDLCILLFALRTIVGIRLLLAIMIFLLSFLHALDRILHGFCLGIAPTPTRLT